jgi:bacterioferritin-associated ferredoxin
MSKKEAETGSLPTKSPSPQRTARLTKRLLVTDKALQHLVGHGMITIEQIRDAGCCAPDGGTCCPNKGRMIRKLETQLKEAKAAVTKTLE